MVLIWLMMVNNTWLVVLTILKNMKVNGKDDNPCMKWKINNLWNHQQVMCFFAVTKTKHARIEKHGYSLKETHRNCITSGNYAKIQTESWNNADD